MADNNDVRHIVHNIGLTAGTTMTPVFKNVTANGCNSILDANIWSGGAGTVTAYLVRCDATGGTVLGTIASLGSAAQIYAAAGTAALVKAGTVTSAIVGPNQVVSVELGEGEAGTDTHVAIAYVKGHV